MASKRSAMPLSLLLAAALLLPAHGLSSGTPSAGKAQTDGARPPQAATGGLLFIENAGQWPEAARFQVWGGGPTLWLAEDALWLTVMGESANGGVGDGENGRRGEWEDLARSPTRPLAASPRGAASQFKLSFPGANPQPVLEPFARLDTHVSYFLGSDPAGWWPDVPVWGGVRYAELYPGVDLVVGVGLAPALDGGRSQGSPLPWRLEARGGVDLGAVRLRVEGADTVAVEGNVLRLSTAAGAVSLPLLTAEGANVQRSNAERANASAFDVTAPFYHPPTSPLPVSPEDVTDLVYGTFLGGSDNDYGYAIAVDGAGRTYVTGHTGSNDFPTTPGAFNTISGGAFVVKLDPAGGLSYATFLGGSLDSGGFGIAVDAAGSAHVTGYTNSSDFPVTPGAFDTSFNGGSYDAFAVKLDPVGSSLFYATFLGGSGGDNGRAIAVDGAGRAYVVGDTSSGDFPATPGAFDTALHGGGDAFVAKLDPAGMSLAYATFLGGSGGDYGNAIAVDTAGHAYVTGSTDSSNFPVTPGAFDTSYSFYADAFVVKLDPAGSGLAYATFLSGSGGDYGRAIAVDAAGSAYVTGQTWSSDFPVTPGAFDTSNNGSNAVFVAKLGPAGDRLGYSTFLGGGVYDFGDGIAVDTTGYAYVSGSATSDGFPVTPGAFDTSFSGGDAFMIKLDPTGSTLGYGTFLGGSDYDEGHAIAADGEGRIYVTGYTNSSDFPTTPRAFDTSYSGGADAFVIKLNPARGIAGGVLAAHRAGVRPLVDGDLSEWQFLGATFLNADNASFIGGSQPNPSHADLSASLRLAWAPEGLYAAATVADDVLIGNNSPNPWQDDAFELSVHVPTDRTHQFTLVIDGRQADQGNPIASLTFVTRTMAGGWQFEAFIPAAALGLPGGLGIANYPSTFALCDDDIGGSPPSGTQTHMFWRGSSSYTHQPGQWARLELSGWTVDFNPSQNTATPTATQTATLTPTPTATTSPTPLYAQTLTPSRTPTLSPMPTHTSTPVPGSIAGVVWHDRDGDGRQTPDEPGVLGVVVKLVAGGLQIGETPTLGDGAYHFGALPPGAYVVWEVQPAWLRFSSTPDEVVVVVQAGQELRVDFGDWNGVVIWLPLIVR